jgi:hypothetical protein
MKDMVGSALKRFLGTCQQLLDADPRQVLRPYIETLGNFLQFGEAVIGKCYGKGAHKGSPLTEDYQQYVENAINKNTASRPRHCEANAMRLSRGEKASLKGERFLHQS